ncbi:MAG: hypothetical protein A2X49_11595 [Lentisphaerae bacterium GWF2_52_8]|nr:MAG: hypothetical protein A2X49_11595 [Lentisphaerae bacterium GWF2_52_8]
MEDSATAIIDSMRKYFGNDQRRIMHAMKVLHYAKQIQVAEGGSAFVVKAAAALHDIGIHEAERKHNSTAGKYQEMEGPPIARKILGDHKVSEPDIEHICRIVANHHSAKDIDTPEFRAVWDADWLVNIPEELDMADLQRIELLINDVFKTETGRKIACQIFLNK